MMRMMRMIRAIRNHETPSYPKLMGIPHAMLSAWRFQTREMCAVLFALQADHQILAEHKVYFIVLNLQ